MPAKDFEAQARMRRWPLRGHQPAAGSRLIQAGVWTVPDTSRLEQERGRGECRPRIQTKSQSQGTRNAGPERGGRRRKGHEKREQKPAKHTGGKKGQSNAWRSTQNLVMGLECPCNANPEPT